MYNRLEMLKILIMLKKEKAAGYSIFIKGKFTKRICRTYTKNRKIRQICKETEKFKPYAKKNLP